MLVDLCKSADIAEPENDTPLYLDDSSCKVSGKSPPFNEYLNLKTPLQIGGRYGKEFDPAEYNWKAVPRGKGFDGCIRNILHNSKVMWITFILLLTSLLDCQYYIIHTSKIN